MDITIVTSARNNEDALELLKLMGMPFAESKGKDSGKEAKPAAEKSQP